MIQFADKDLNRMAILSSLRRDETIACENATVVVDGNGNFSCWFNNDVPLHIIEIEDIIENEEVE